MRNKIRAHQYLLGSILLLLLFFLFIFIPINSYPAEDAAILFQYSENLSQTGEIAYNLNDIHAEGATDFLWMVLLAIMHFIGFNTYLAATFLSMLAIIGTGFLLFKLTGGKNINYFLAFMFLLIALPMTPASIQGFSPLFFGFFIILTTYYFLRNNYRFFFISALLLCLVRPDGIIFALPLTMIILFENKIKFKLKIKYFLIYFFLPGLIYFIWRWNYFGEFLPLPFYVKSNFNRFLFLFNKGSLWLNLKYLLIYFSPTFIFIIGLLLQKKVDRKIKTLLLFAIVFIPFIFYSSMNLSQNISHRFQYSFVLGLFIVLAYTIQKFTRKKNPFNSFCFSSFIYLKAFTSQLFRLIKSA